MVQQRYVLTALLFFSLGISFALRIIFPLVLTQMVYVPNSSENNTDDSSIEETCPVSSSKPENDTSNPITNNSDRYQWSQQLQGVILSSFHMGNILTQVPGGVLVQKFGGKLCFLVSTFASATVFASIPFAVDFGDSYGLIATLILCGILAGPMIPAISSFAISWYPIEERGRTIAIVFMGINIIGIISTYLSGLALQYGGHWSIIFYGLTVVSIISGILFAIFCYESPQYHPFISEKEKKFLELKTSMFLESKRENLPPTPWKHIFTSKPLLALLVSQTFYMWSYTVITTNTPKYLNDVLHTPIEKTSVYMTIPRVISIFLSISAGFINDWMYTKWKINLTNIRKTFALLASIIPAIFAIATSYGGCDEMLVVILISIAIAGQGFDIVGSLSNAFDLGPNYIGPINAILFMVTSSATFSAPYIVGVLTPNSYRSEYRLVFWLTFIFFIFKAVIFTIWGSADVQPWNSP